MHGRVDAHVRFLEQETETLVRGGLEGSDLPCDFANELTLPLRKILRAVQQTRRELRATTLEVVSRSSILLYFRTQPLSYVPNVYGAWFVELKLGRT